ncbi:MAG: hypothetical protein ACOYNS_14285 [Bacteroidota bacterium]
MGSSKIIMLSGIYLIFGFYIKSYNNVDEAVYKISLKSATMAQAEQLAETGITLAKSYLGGSAANTFGPKTFISGNDTVQYSASSLGVASPSQTMVTSTASHYTTVMVAGSPTVKVVRRVVQTALMQYHNARWKQIRIYTTRNYQDTF